MIKIFKRIRKYYYRRLIIKKARAISLPFTVNGPSYINNYTYLGKNVNFNGIKIIGHGEVYIGDNFHSGQNCFVITDTHNYNGEKIPYDNTYIVRTVKIEDNVWIGHGVIILGGVTIGEGAIIQAGSVVVRDIPKYGIAGGHPASVFKYRNVEKYLVLKREGKFH